MTTKTSNGKKTKSTATLKVENRISPEQEHSSPRKPDKVRTERCAIKPIKMQTGIFRIRGTAPYVQNRFSKKAMEIIRDQQTKGDTAKTKKREPKNFDDLYVQSQHRSPDGWWGIPASAFRLAAVDVCRVAGYHMTKAKMSVFCVADGYSEEDHSTGLVRLLNAEPKHVEHAVRIQKTVDIRVRSMFEAGWEAELKFSWDADQFETTDIANLIMRMGVQVGVGEGRPYSKMSCGMGWGTFELVM